MLPVYEKLFNLVLDTGVVPEHWTTGFLTPIFKGMGQMMDPQSYRPITILSCLGKLFTSILNERLTNFSNIYGFFL